MLLHSQMPSNGEMESFRRKLSRYTVNTRAREAVIGGNCLEYSPEVQKGRENQEQSKHYYLPYREMEGWRKKWDRHHVVLGGAVGTGQAKVRADDPIIRLCVKNVCRALSSSGLILSCVSVAQKESAKQSVLNPSLMLLACRDGDSEHLS